MGLTKGGTASKDFFASSVHFIDPVSCFQFVCSVKPLADAGDKVPVSVMGLIFIIAMITLQKARDARREIFQE